MNPHIHIEGLVNIANLSTKTMRYYEEIGLISPSKRTENEYKTYDTRQIEELQLIRQAQELNMSMITIHKLMKGCIGDSYSHTKTYTLQEISAYIQKIDEQITQFTLIKRKMNELKKHIKKMAHVVKIAIVVMRSINECI